MGDATVRAWQIRSSIGEVVIVAADDEVTARRIVREWKMPGYLVLGTKPHDIATIEDLGEWPTEAAATIRTSGMETVPDQGREGSHGTDP